MNFRFHEGKELCLICAKFLVPNTELDTVNNHYVSPE